MRHFSFTSHKLGQELLKKKLTVMGTIQKNKLRPGAQTADYKGQACHIFQVCAHADTSLDYYVPKKSKNVILMCTLNRDGRICVQEHRKPRIILDCNTTKQGVDNMDKLMTTYHIYI